MVLQQSMEKTAVCISSVEIGYKILKKKKGEKEDKKPVFHV